MIFAEIVRAPATAATVAEACGYELEVVRAMLNYFARIGKCVRMGRVRNGLTNRPNVVWGLAGRDGEPEPYELLARRIHLSPRPACRRESAGSKAPAPYIRGYRWHAGE